MTDSQVAVRRIPGLPDQPGGAPTQSQQLAPPVRVRWLVTLLLLLGIGVFGGLGSWAALAPLRSAVIASGTVKVSLFFILFSMR